MSFQQPELLICGKRFFERLAESIRTAQTSIIVNMFIWRNDELGVALALLLLNAADRGVRISICKDRYGVILECCEENCASFFHNRMTLGEKAQSFCLKHLYRLAMPSAPVPQNIVDRLRRHPNIRIDDNHYRRDHSKFWIFDDKTLYLGGINVENKEKDADSRGYNYHDYMVCLQGREIVEAFLAKRQNPAQFSQMFGMNLKTPAQCFEMRERYLSLIQNAKQTLDILMAYFAPEEDFLDEIASACKRGVKVRLLLPQNANFNHHLNMLTAYRLLGNIDRNLNIFLSPKMVHAKVLVNEKILSLGSCNINRKAFCSLDELNLFWPNDSRSFASSLRENIESLFQEAHLVKSRQQLHVNWLWAAAEHVIMQGLGPEQ